MPAPCSDLLDARLYAPAARKQVEDDDDDGYYQQNVNPPTDGVNANDAEKPKNDEDDSDCPKHGIKPPKNLNAKSWCCKARLPLLDASTTGKEVEDQDDNGENQKDVNEVSTDVKGKEAEQPEDE
jgi:hypothetical protein